MKTYLVQYEHLSLEWDGAALLCYRNHTKITTVMQEQKPYLVWFLCQHESYMVQSEHSQSQGQSVVIACVAWRFWLGTLSNKGGRGKRNHEEIGAAATSWLCCSFLRTSHMNFVASSLMRPAQQNHHATQATVVTFIFSPPNWREATIANTTATELGDYSEI